MFFHLNFVIFQYIHHSLRVQSIFLDIRKNTIFNKHPIPKKASLYSSICCSVNSMSPNLRGLLSSTSVTYDTKNWRMKISGSEGRFYHGKLIGPGWDVEGVSGMRVLVRRNGRAVETGSVFSDREDVTS